MTTITSLAQLDALPVGTTLVATWPDSDRGDHHAVRVPHGGAGVPGWGMYSGDAWSHLWTWGATLTVLHTDAPPTDALEEAERIWQREVRPAAATLAISELRDEHRVPELGTLLWGKPDISEPVTNVVLRVIEPLVEHALARALHSSAPAAGTLADVPTSEVLQAAGRLTPMLSEDGDWIVDPESRQFQNDVKTVLRAVGVEPVQHTY